MSEAAVDTVPKPVVKIDNQSDPFATVVSIQFGDRLGELLDTVRFWFDSKALTLFALLQHSQTAPYCLYHLQPSWR